MIARACLPVVLALVAGCAAVPETSPRVLVPFTTDGCSAFPDRSPLRDGADWCDCCVAHDLRYWRGGTAVDREAADRELEACLKARTGGPVLGAMMRLGVQVGGSPAWSASWRWGYGWPYVGDYRALTPEEVARADELERAALADPSRMSCPTRRAP